MKIRNGEKIILPLLLIIFLITYHYYAFYQNDFNKIFRYIKFTFSQNQYEKIQEFHPFYQIYKISEDTKKSEKNIIYVRTKADPKNRQYLDELNIMVNYFFYPRFIKPYSLTQFYKIKLNHGDVIISDYPLKTFKPVPFVKKNLLRINKWPEDSYFIYEVI
jgi:hypothetical protein